VPLLLTDAPRLELGPQIGVDWASQQLQSGQSYGTLDLRAEGVLSFSYPVGILRVGTDVTAGVHRFELNDVGVYRFAGGAAVTLGAEF